MNMENFIREFKIYCENDSEAKKCLELLRDNNWVEVNYNAKTIRTFSETINYECGKLRRIS